jgi:hypothetical protein
MLAAVPATIGYCWCASERGKDTKNCFNQTNDFLGNIHNGRTLKSFGVNPGGILAILILRLGGRVSIPLKMM